MAGGCSNFKERCCSRNLHQDNQRRRNHDGRSGVQNHTERAMVRICGDRVHVRNLDNGYQRKQSQTHECHRDDRAGPRASGTAKECPKSVQEEVPH